MLTLIVAGLIAAGALTLAGYAAVDFHREGIARLERAGYRKHAAPSSSPSNVRVIPAQRTR